MNAKLSLQKAAFKLGLLGLSSYCIYHGLGHALLGTYIYGKTSVLYFALAVFAEHIPHEIGHALAATNSGLKVSHIQFLFFRYDSGGKITFKFGQPIIHYKNKTATIKQGIIKALGGPLVDLSIAIVGLLTDSPYVTGVGLVTFGINMLPAFGSDGDHIAELACYREDNTTT